MVFSCSFSIFECCQIFEYLIEKLFMMTPIYELSIGKNASEARELFRTSAKLRLCFWNFMHALANLQIIKGKNRFRIAMVYSSNFSASACRQNFECVMARLFKLELVSGWSIGKTSFGNEILFQGRHCGCISCSTIMTLGLIENMRNMRRERQL